MNCALCNAESDLVKIKDSHLCATCILEDVSGAFDEAVLIMCSDEEDDDKVSKCAEGVLKLYSRAAKKVIKQVRKRDPRHRSEVKKMLTQLRNKKRRRR